MVDLLYPMNDNNNVSNSFNFSRHEELESFRPPITGNNGAGPSASASAGADANASADANANASAGVDANASVSVGTSGLVKKPRKKRSKVIEVGEPLPEGSSVPLKPKPVKKPQTGSPNSTRPCSECGKQFWSWKALFGHMRCHPERHWRGINPPPNLQKPALPENNPASGLESTMTYEDHEVANCLIMLANGSPLMDTPGVTIDRGRPESRYSTGETSVAVDNDGAGPSDLSGRFECTSCKKVFGSHQALGGHRASHKNVKGCFAIARTDDEDEDHNGEHRDDGFGDGKGKETAEEKMMMVLGHKCDICLRVFSSGQALGGHKRRHWEKGDEPPQQSLHPSTSKEDCVLDLNLPAPIENNGDFSTTSSELALDLKLGI